ncbi:ATP-binding protein [Weissella viridescens]|uniref:ATP-binding protein n=1 Tax=Weissella viridescens TaxID=1629 RepID=UPI001FD1BFCC|nr:ATP-binding protein [Weissella viridescens]
MLKSPIKAIKDNLLLTTTGDVWGYYRIKSQSIANHDLKQKEERKQKLAFLFKELAGYGEFELTLVPRELDLEERFFGETSLSNDFADDVRDVAEHYARKQIKLLNHEFGTTTESYYVIGIKLKSARYDHTLRSSVSGVLDDFVQTLAPQLGYDVVVDDKFFETYQDVAEEVENSLSSVGGEAFTEDDLAYFIRYNFLRGIKHSVLDESQDHYLENLLDGSLNASHKGALYLKNKEGEGYVAFLPISSTPTDLTNSHFFEQAQMKKFPVEFHMKVITEKKSGFGKNLKSRLGALGKEMVSEDKDAYQSGQLDNSDKRKTARFLLNQMRNGLDRGNEYFRWLGVFVIYADDLDELRKRVASFRKTMAQRKVELSQASAQQVDLFYRLLPGYSLEGEQRWLQYSSQDGLAQNLFGISHQLGNHTGFVIGRVSSTRQSQSIKKSIYSSKDLVFFNPLVTNQGVTGSVTDSPHITVTGQTGRGKSFLVKLIMMYLSMMNAKLLYVDPKQEVKRWFNRATSDPGFKEKYPELIKLISQFHFTTLDQANRENWGSLDPIVFLAGIGNRNESMEPDTDPAYDVAVAMFNQIFEIRDPLAKAELEQAIKMTIRRKWAGERVGMLTVLDVMESEAQRTDYKELAQAIRKRVTGGILRLSFSDGHNDSVSFNTRINILEVAGLDLPNEDVDPSTYTDVQKTSLATMFALGKFADKFGRENPDEYTFEIIDEAWIFQTSSTGRAILKSIKRVGRSFNNALVYATQSIDDLSGENDHGQVGVVFAFNEPSETTKILDYVGIEPSAENVEWFSKFIKGETLFRDIYGRVGKMAVHSMFPEFTLLFKTVEDSASAKAEEKWH